MANQYNGNLLTPIAPNLPIAPVDYSQQYQDQLNNTFRLYFTQIDNFTQASATPDTGLTTQRPTNKLQIGRQFFDTTLGYPIWWNGKAWVNASGTAV
jgi:hypothetical protein